MKTFFATLLCVFALHTGAFAETDGHLPPTDGDFVPSTTPIKVLKDTLVGAGGDAGLSRKATVIAYALGSNEWAELKKVESIHGENIGAVSVTATEAGYRVSPSWTESQLSFSQAGGTQNTPQQANIFVEVDAKGNLGAVTAHFGRAMATPMFPVPEPKK